jgi:hypothetical protein
VALAYWLCYREHPRLHPRCNDAEIALLAEGRGEFQPVKDPPSALSLCSGLPQQEPVDVNGVQFFTNIGWAFLILSLPDYLKKVMHLDDGMSGTHDHRGADHRHRGAADRRHADGPDLPPHGKRWAHAADVGDEIRRRRLLCARLYTTPPGAWRSCLASWPSLPTSACRPCGRLMQDISGKHQAQLFGWGNMWGNFGAAILPVMFTAVLKAFDTNHDYHEGVWLCAGGLCAGGCLRVVRQRGKTRDAGFLI